MNKLSMCIFTGVLWLTLTVTATAQTTADTPVTVIIEGNGVNTAPTLRLQSDLKGAYAHSKSLQSIIQGIGDWEMDAVNFTGSGRTILVDLRDPVPNSAPGGKTPVAPFAPQLLPMRFISKCSQLGLKLQNMTYVGETYLCPLVVRVELSSTTAYSVRMNPTTYAETNWAQWTCMAAANSKCTQWKAEPSAIHGVNERKNVAQVLKLVTSKGKTTETDAGDFYLSFAINLTNP